MGHRRKHPVPDELSEPVPVTDVLDLHGFFPEQIPEVVTEFIGHAASLKLHEVRIIHGKGRSRLKWEVHRVLESLPQVVAFGDAGAGSRGVGGDTGCVE